MHLPPELLAVRAKIGPPPIEVRDVFSARQRVSEVLKINMPVHVVARVPLRSSPLTALSKYSIQQSISWRKIGGHDKIGWVTLKVLPTRKNP
jgi:hypothetical protein